MTERKISLEEALATVDVPDGPGENKLHDELRWHEPSMHLVGELYRADPDRVTRTTDSGMMAIHVFARNLVNPEVLDFLLSCYPDSVRTPNNFGMLPLHKAASCRHADGDAFKKLIEAYPEALLKKDKNGSTPLHIAVSGLRPTLSIVGTLIRERAKAAKYKDKRKKLPLHRLCETHMPQENTEDTVRCFELLIEAFPDAVKRQDCDGNLPLHLQARREEPNIELINLLLFQWPEAAVVKNYAGQTSQDLALYKGQTRHLLTVSALLNYENIREQIALTMQEDEDSDDEEALLKLLEGAGVNVGFDEKMNRRSTTMLP